MAGRIVSGKCGKLAIEEKIRNFPSEQNAGLPGTEAGNTRPASGEFAVLPPWGKGLYRGYSPVPRRPEAGTKKTAAARTGARKTVIHQKLQIYGICLTGLETNEHTAFSFG